MHELQPWVPSIIALVSAVAVIATLRSDARHAAARAEAQEKKIDELERKLDRITPRAAAIDGLERDVAGLREGITDLRIQLATRAPTSAPRRHRTPPTGVPVRRDSDET